MAYFLNLFTPKTWAAGSHQPCREDMPGRNSATSGRCENTGPNIKRRTMAQVIGHLALCVLMLSGLEMAAAEQEEEAMQSYLDYVMWVLERHHRYPEYAELKKLSGQVVLQFTVRSDGRIVDPKVVESTGHFLFGHAALQALRQVGRLPPFPLEIRRNEILMEVPINYRIKGSEEGS